MVYLRERVKQMRRELRLHLPSRIIDVIEPDDVIRMHHHKIGNDLLKEKYHLSTQSYIDMYCRYDAISKITYL